MQSKTLLIYPTLFLFFRVHQASTGLDILRVVKISQAQAWQRAGRAGRDSEGNCYRMITRNEFERLDKETVPEIKRCSISTVILQMLSIGIRDISKFDFLDPPPQDAIGKSKIEFKFPHKISSDFF